jgi:uncharacterized protein with NAD-binding domain and iron-sulfur cluster
LHPREEESRSVVRTERKKVAIVGGGFAAMAAAWELTSPDNPDACDVTIFQMGGRLGGKAASSRNPDFGDRVEEHGLHLWLGYYDNAFRMVRTCFDELRALEPADPELKQHLASAPFNNWDWLSAFERASLVGLADYSSGEWTHWIARFPEYVMGDERGTGIYKLANGTVRPGIHIVDDQKRAYPGEAPVVARGDACENGEDICLEQPNVAFFLTHALRELQAFVESLQLRIDHLFVPKSGDPLADDPEELLSQMMNLNPVTRADQIDVLSSDIPRALRMVRLTFLVPAIQACATAARILEGPAPHLRNHVVAMLDRFVDEMREKIETFVQSDPPARRIWELIDLLAANIRGLVAAGLEGSDDFSSLDEFNYQDWLRMNRVAERTLRNPIARGAHDLGFAYANGDPRDPQIAAGQALDAACRFFFMYKGALFWRLKAGMGDVVFAPMYLALRSRGVKFRFFHRLDEIDLDEDGTTVRRLRLWRQVKLSITDREAPTNYKPLVIVDNKEMSGWRARPHKEQFAYDQQTIDAYDRALNGEDRRAYMNFESVWCNWEHGEAVFATVGGRAGDGEQANPFWVGHYDDVIVTVPIAALGRVSRQLGAARHDAGRRWREMLKHLGTVATQTMQVWVTKTTRELGWTHGQVSYSAFVHPFDTWADLSQLIQVENQPDAHGVHYFCSVLPAEYVPPIDADPAQIAETLEAVAAVVRENARRFLSDWVLHLWPDAVQRYPNVFKWELLVAKKEQAGARRLESQHIVANVDPSERYTQSLPGTTKYRIRPDDTGFEHLFIAGDWTDCGFNVGCVESAVISGRLASAGITGFPDTRVIPGYVRPMGRVAAAKGGN